MNDDILWLIRGLNIFLLYMKIFSNNPLINFNLLKGLRKEFIDQYSLTKFKFVIRTKNLKLYWYLNKLLMVYFSLIKFQFVRWNLNGIDQVV